jgi:hypothetical protein
MLVMSGDPAGRRLTDTFFSDVERGRREIRSRERRAAYDARLDCSACPSASPDTSPGGAGIAVAAATAVNPASDSEEWTLGG